MLGDLLVSAQQAAHNWLREMILSGELHAGQALRQEEIARRLGISRLPIREALNRLATEGLVELKPRRGFYVASLNIDEIEDIFEMRAMLEAKGVQFSGDILDTGVCHMAFFADPDGNELMLHRRYAPYE